MNRGFFLPKSSLEQFDSLNLAMFKSKKDTVYVVLAGIFITNAVVAELIGGKLIHVGSAVMSVGILPWPVVL